MAMYKSRLILELGLIPNLISLFRISLTVPIFILFPNPSGAAYTTVVVLIILSYVSDYFDGLVARRFGMKSDLGLILDPVADKIWTAVMVYLLCTHRGLPVWVGFTIVARDLIILGINARIIQKKWSLLPSDNIGRQYMVLLGLVIIGLSLNLRFIMWFAYVIVGFGLVTVVHYSQRYLRLARSENAVPFGVHASEAGRIETPKRPV